MEETTFNTETNMSRYFFALSVCSQDTLANLTGLFYCSAIMTNPHVPVKTKDDSRAQMLSGPLALQPDVKKQDPCQKMSLLASL